MKRRWGGKRMGCRSRRCCGCSRCCCFSCCGGSRREESGIAKIIWEKRNCTASCIGRKGHGFFGVSVRSIPAIRNPRVRKPKNPNSGCLESRRSKSRSPNVRNAGNPKFVCVGPENPKTDRGGRRRESTQSEGSLRKAVIYVYNRLMIESNN